MICVKKDFFCKSLKSPICVDGECTIDPVLDKQQGTRDRINQVSELEKRRKLIWTLPMIGKELLLL